MPAASNRRFLHAAHPGAMEMTPLEAKRILTPWTVTEDTISGDGGVRVKLHDAIWVEIMGGEFYSDELEAIATWMRDPKSVSEAKEPEVLAI